MVQGEVEVKSLPELHVACLRYEGSYAGNTELFGTLIGQLFAWAGPRGLIRGDTAVMSLYEENQEGEAEPRFDVAITLPEGTTVEEGEIRERTVPANSYAVGHFRIAADQYGEVWDYMMADWLPKSGYDSVAAPCLEIYRNDPSQDPEGKHVVDICVPVRAKD